MSEETKWQPIDTAPKDGRLVLLGRVTSNIPYAGGYFSEYGWADTNGALRDPTHWMPLPSQPGWDS